ncbi:ferredoxin reductase [Maribrevibacterium harenarium]|uniref:Ferredoxin reductase n=1 Tax=Maribrevibacterium harenarium TaxID=2589817 RepID=A0A501WQG8_9GAMM|nr:FAD-dependent oxidoreductase [Maribrevibacterium harenarium]TPE49497.1 ferredoxin reductase [Maribrevibacterium harenarium]
MSQTMIIIGAGEAGVRAARTLRQHNSEIAIHLFEGEQGLPYERPPLSKNALLDDAFSRKLIISAEELAQLSIHYHSDTCVEALLAETKQIRLTNGKLFGFDKLLIATGAKARTLPLLQQKGLDQHPLLFSLRSAADCQRIRNQASAGQHVVLVGAGFIGLELAASLRSKGLKVTVLESQARILQRAVPAPIAEVLAQSHAEHGVDIRLNCQIEDIRLNNEVEIDLAGQTSLKADWLVVGIGAEPNIHLANHAGLALENGIQVDAAMQTSHPDIFAAGDVCNFLLSRYGTQVRLESWRCAQEQAEVAALNMLGGAVQYVQAPWFWSDQYDLGLQSVGLSINPVTKIERRYDEQTRLYIELDSQQRILCACAIGLGNSVAKDIKVIERLINQNSIVDITTLGDVNVPLKSLLKRAKECV